MCCFLQWTLMSYMVEGGGSPTLSRAKAWLYSHPESAHRLLGLLAETCAAFLVEQVHAGAQVVWVGHCGVAMVTAKMSCSHSSADGPGV